MANEWGCQILPASPGSRRAVSYDALRFKSDLRALRLQASNCIQPFQLEKVLGCGSDANTWAVMYASEGDSKAVLYATGTYVAGDNSALQGYTTSTFRLGGDYAVVVSPSDNQLYGPAKPQVVGLPYYILKESDRDLHQYEEECLRSLHIRCLVSAMNQRPIKVILLELLLAGSGAKLSDRFLIQIAKLSIKHGFTFVVDEIMTAGRTTPDSMLLLLTKPQSFVNRVACVTLGKWTKAGLVLVHKELGLEIGGGDPNSIQYARRGASTHVSIEETTQIWKAVRDALPRIETRRQQAINHLDVASEECWGEGCLLFAPKVRRGAYRGIGGRHVPMLDTDVKLDPFKANKSVKTMAKLCSELRDTIQEWLQFSYKIWPTHIIDMDVCNVLSRDEFSIYCEGRSMSAKTRLLQRHWLLELVNQHRRMRELVDVDDHQHPEGMCGSIPQSGCKRPRSSSPSSSGIYVLGQLTKSVDKLIASDLVYDKCHGSSRNRTMVLMPKMFNVPLAS